MRLKGANADVASILLTSRLNSGKSIVVQSMELEVIASVIIGGTKLFGGVGSVLGALFMATIKSQHGADECVAL